jgi:hypothetical protein
MGDVAFEAHIAGFVFGVAIAFFVKRLALEEQFSRPAVEDGEVVHEARSLETAHQLAGQNRFEEAITLLEAELERDPRNVDAASALWNIAAAAGRHEQVAQYMIPALEASARSGDDGLPALCWGDILRTVPEIGIASATAVRLGELVLAAGLDDDAAETLTWIEGRVDASTPVGQLARLARMAGRIGLRAPYAELALARPELPQQVADELRGLVDRRGK